MDVPPDYRISIIINQWNQRLLSNYYFMGRSVLFPRFNQPWRGDLTLRHIHLPVARARHDVHLQYVSNPSSSATTTSARGNVIVSTFPTGSLDSIHPQGPTLLERASLPLDPCLVCGVLAIIIVPILLPFVSGAVRSVEVQGGIISRSPLNAIIDIARRTVDAHE